MRASRLVNLLLLLQTRGQLSAPELARELEVSTRTVYRDVEALSEAGVPIYAERGPHGGIRLVDGYRTRLTGLTPEEADALFMSGLPGPAAELGLGTVVAAARLKVLAALPPELRTRAARLTERFHLDAPAWFRTPDEVPHLEVLAGAVWDGRRLEIRYRRSPDRVVTRQVEPLGLVLKAGTWYLVGRCEGQDRTYRVSQIVEASAGSERFDRPPEFDLASFWAESIAAYERQLPRLAVTLRLAPAGVAVLRDVIGRRATEAAVTAADPEPEGSLRIQLTFESIEEAMGPVMRLGAYAEVLDPPVLRDAVLDAALGIVGRYRSAVPEVALPLPGVVSPRPGSPQPGRRDPPRTRD